MAVAEVEGNGLALLCDPVTDADDLELLGVALRNTDDHVVE